MSDKIGRLKEEVKLLGEREQLYHRQLLVLSEAFGSLFNSGERLVLKWKHLKEHDDPAVEAFLDHPDLIELRAYLEGVEATMMQLAPAMGGGDVGSGTGGDNPAAAGEAPSE